jgi:hypothetical protein
LDINIDGSELCKVENEERRLEFGYIRQALIVVATAADSEMYSELLGTNYLVEYKLNN